ncbi:Dipeptidyl peptidase IV, putative [Rhodococcus sp. AW25M09]|uniref:hypothetical protein n=1 Tax=Rhodococcus sp. AW25M09 TaxID=1268303 RepID=UPI0002AC6882|nr:hypothetical protein [Rhodococcus sp. AW25M09]CCQ15637.1 Dipeptidyl peptidase IV, putative [Rhodococcus sp. AW25M09]
MGVDLAKDDEDDAEDFEVEFTPKLVRSLLRDIKLHYPGFVGTFSLVAGHYSALDTNLPEAYIRNPRTGQWWTLEEVQDASVEVTDHEIRSAKRSLSPKAGGGVTLSKDIFNVLTAQTGAGIFEYNPVLGNWFFVPDDTRYGESGVRAR